MNIDAKTMLIRIYEMLLIHHDAVYESLHASQALIQAVSETQPALWNRYHKIHLEQQAKSAKQEAALRSQIEEVIRQLKENLPA